MKKTKKRPIEWSAMKGKRLTETDKAVLVQVDNQKVWVPRQCFRERSDGETILIAAWFSKKEIFRRYA